MTEEVQLTKAWAKFAMSSTSGKEGYECWASDAADDQAARDAHVAAAKMRIWARQEIGVAEKEQP